jgi:tRNA pseudouridine55 synthase
MSLLEFDLPYITIKARVSKGTYIRSLVNDLANFVGLNATTYELTRTNIGQMSLQDSVELKEIRMKDDVEKILKKTSV